VNFTGILTLFSAWLCVFIDYLE